MELVIPHTEHISNGTLNKDANNHWYGCTDCSGHVNEAPHHGEADCTKCDTCGVDFGQHDYSGAYVNTDEEGHYHECLNCGIADAKVHHTMEDNGVAKQPTDEEDGIMNTKCSACGYESTAVIPANKHAASSEYGYNDDEHWFECSEHDDCGAKLEVAEHEWVIDAEHENNKASTCAEAGVQMYKCECGASKAETLAKASHTTVVKITGTKRTTECSVCGEVEKTEKIVMLKPNSNWTQSNARFAVYTFGTVEKWYDMTYDSSLGVYIAVIEDDNANIIFCRMNPGTTANNWNNKWNQTGDLKFPTNGNNLFTVPNGVWDGSTSGWSTKNV